MSFSFITSFILVPTQAKRILFFKNTHNFTLRMLCFPNCKINIGLYITSRRADGYHDLETIFYPLPLCDVLEAVPATETQLHQSGLTVAGNTTDNLVWQACQLLKTIYNDKL